MKTPLIVFLYICFMVLPRNMNAQGKSFVPEDFRVPDTLETEHFRLRMLTVNDLVKDYDAVMSSVNELQKQFPHWKWPASDLSMEQDLIDLGWHQKEFQRRTSFAYTVVSPDESQVLGCLYLFPTSKGNFDATAEMWMRTSVLDKGYDALLYRTVKEWLDKDWPFENVAYPLREISLEEWQNL